MGNNYFQFKQFTVYQHRSTLKVSTDSCIFGAWIAENLAIFGSLLPVDGSGLPVGDAVLLAPDVPLMTPRAPLRLLDIGAGTGLLMLMVAQQWGGPVDGIEIDKNAFEQALDNIQASPWAGRLQLFNGDVTSFAPAGAYDLIISNPPFYESDLRSPLLHKNLAKHATGLTLEALLGSAGRLAAPHATLVVLLSWRRMDAFKAMAAAQGWRVARQLLVKQTPSHDYFRAALWLEREYSGEPVTDSLVIHTAERVYTEEMTALLKPYYLYL